MSYGVGRRCGSDFELLWLWHRPVATAPIGPLAWELPYAVGVAPKRQNKTNKKNPGKLDPTACRRNYWGKKAAIGDADSCMKPIGKQWEADRTRQVLLFPPGFKSPSVILHWQNLPSWQRRNVVCRVPATASQN